MQMVKPSNYCLFALAQCGASEDVGLFPRTEKSHSERCDSLMELCTVSAGRQQLCPEMSRENPRVLL